MTRAEKHDLIDAWQQEKQKLTITERLKRMQKRQEDQHKHEIAELTSRIDDRTKRMVWAAVLEGAKHTTCTPYENATSLLKAHWVIFGNETTAQEETPSLNMRKEL